MKRTDNKNYRKYYSNLSKQPKEGLRISSAISNILLTKSPESQ